MHYKSNAMCLSQNVEVYQVDMTKHHSVLTPYTHLLPKHAQPTKPALHFLRGLSDTEMWELGSGTAH